MSRLEDLPPDLRAALSLLVDRGKSYADVADLLGIPESAVRERAHAALDALAGPSSANGSPAPHAGAEALRSAGVGGSSGRSPEPPATASPGAGGSAPGRGGSSESEQPGAEHQGVPASELGGSRRTPPRANGRGGEPSLGTGNLPVSRRGGAILLSVIAVVVVVVVVLITSGGGSSHKSTGASASAKGTSSTATNSSGKTPRITKQLTLTPHGGSNAIGIAEVLAEGSQRAIYVAAEKLEPSKGFFYVIWLYSSPSHALALGRAPNVSSNGRMQGGTLLPSNAADYHQLLLTRETNEHPAHPGPVVLSGPFSLGS